MQLAQFVLSARESLSGRNRDIRLQGTIPFRPLTTLYKLCRGRRVRLSHSHIESSSRDRQWRRDGIEVRLIQLIRSLLHILTSGFTAKLCRNFALGHCPQGDQCKYLHSSVVPVQSTYAIAPIAAPPMVCYVARGRRCTNAPKAYMQARHGELNPHFSFPPPAVGMHFNWPPMSPPVQSPQASGYNWGYQPVSPPLPAAVPTTQPTQFRPLSWRTTLCRHFVKNQGWCPLGDECG